MSESFSLNLNPKMLITTAAFSIVAIVFIFTKRSNSNSEIAKKIREFDNAVMKKSLISCPSTPFLKRITYDIDGNLGLKSKKKKLCLVNGWVISHILCYGTLAFLFPEYALFFALLGVVWEVYEMKDDSQNWLDLLWNAIGIVLGVSIAKAIK
jgi:hypothetical protein